MYSVHIPRITQFTKIAVSGKPITMPNRSVDIKTAIKNMAFGSIENRAGAFYEEQGIQIPDFRMMDRIQKLQALEQYRADVNKLRNKALTIESNYLTAKKSQNDKQKAQTGGTPDTGGTPTQHGTDSGTK